MPPLPPLLVIMGQLLGLRAHAAGNLWRSQVNLVALPSPAIQSFLPFFSLLSFAPKFTAFLGWRELSCQFLVPAAAPQAQQESF